jgi:methyl-accepting chemotaxis protein
MKIGEVIEEINQVSSTIASAIEEQSITTTEMSKTTSLVSSAAASIALNVEHLAHATENTAESAELTRASVNEITRLAAGLGDLIDALKAQ